MYDEDHHQPEPNYFRLHVDNSPPEKPVFEPEKPPLDEIFATPMPPKEVPPEPIPEPTQEQTPKFTTLKSFGRQLLASLIFLAVGFLVLNWSSYSQIFKLRFDRYFDINQDTPLHDLIQDKPTPQISLSQSEIPPLNLEITPLDNRLIIPRINSNIPIVRVSSESLIKRDFGALEAEMQAALKDGVVHYPGTSLPGQRGNTVITGHSSYFPWDPGRFKDVFALLHDVIVGDKIVVYYKQTKYTYEVTSKTIVLPTEIDVLKQTPNDQITLITCTPVGTNLKRLIVKAKPIAINDRPIEQVSKIGR